MSPSEAAGRIDAPRTGAHPQIEEERDQLADRVRLLAKRDSAVTANVLRTWLRDPGTP